MELDIFSKGKEYISAIRASKKIGYSSDYIGQLCRAKKIPGQLIGKTWHIDYPALVEYKKNRVLGKRRKEVLIVKDNVPLPTVSEVTKKDVSEILTKSPTTSPIASLNNVPIKYEKEEILPLPKLSKKGRYVEPVWNALFVGQVAALSLALIFSMGVGMVTLESTNPNLANKVHERVENITDTGKNFLVKLPSNLNSRIANLGLAKQLAAVSFPEPINSFFEIVASNFHNLKKIALDKFFFAQTPIIITNTIYSPPSPTPSSPPRSVAVTEVTKTFDFTNLKTELKAELESYIRLRISALNPLVIYSSSPSLTLKDVEPSIYYHITNQNNADAERTSVNLSNITDGGVFTDASLSNSTFSGPLVTANALNFSVATGTSATSTNFFSTTASTTNLFFTTGNGGGLTLLGDLTANNGTGRFNNLWANASTTLQNFTFINATGTSATTTNLFSTTASSTNLFSTNLNFGVGTTTGPFAISAAGAGLTFYGTGNHDISAAQGTLRIGANTIIGNILALDNTVDIGDAGTRFDKIYANEINATTLVGTLTGGNLIAETFTINSDNVTADTEDSFLAFERGSVSPNALLTWNSSADRFEFNNPLFISGNASTTGLLSAANLLSTGSSTLQNFTFLNATGTSATTTNLHFSNNLTGPGSFIVNSSGNVGIGTTTPYSKLSVWGANTTAGERAFEVINSASTTLFAIDNAGGATLLNATTTQFTISGASWLGTPSALVGTNITGTGASFTAGAATILATARNINGVSFNGSADITITAASSTLLTDNNIFSGNNMFLASTTIGNGTQAGGLTISGGATSTGNLIVQGTATSTFAAGLQATYLQLTGASATSTFANGLTLTGGCIEVGGTCLGGSASQWTTSGSNIYFNTGSVSIGTTTPGRTFTLFNTAANAQQRISYDATRYAEFYVDASGDLLLTATGKNLRALDANLYLCDGGACPTTPVQGYPSFTSQGNAVFAGTIYAGGFGPATCPSGMIPVPASPADGTQGFCVDKYEAQSSSGNEVSVSGGSPWVSITQTSARAECIRAGKHLITEKEWQTIAHNVENVGWNWNGGVAGTNQMSDGHSDNSPASALATAADSSSCSGTGQTCDLSTWDSQRRIYKLSNDQYIWDFGGNAWEWVDQTVTNDYPVVNSAAAGWQACSTSGDGICGNTRTTNDQWYRGAATAIRGFLRGGGWDYDANVGAFTLNLDNAPSNTSTPVGFRCSR